MPQHGRKIRKLSVTKSHREAMLSNMVASLFTHRLIRTTIPNAKAARQLAEKLITFAKRGGLANQRQIYRTLPDPEVVRKLTGVIVPQFANRQGGYTRVLKLAKRRMGDGAELAVVELLIEKPKIETKKEKKEKKEKEKAKKEEVAAAAKS